MWQEQERGVVVFLEVKCTVANMEVGFKNDVVVSWKD